MHTEILQDIRILGVDTGGTFTDFVYYDQGKLTIHKVLSTPHAPEQAILQGIDDLGLSNTLAQLLIVHGSTVATNAALEKKGVRTVYVANKGMADILTIGRQARQELYNLTPKPALPPVPKALCFEVHSRVDVQGNVLQQLTNEELQQLVNFVRDKQARSVAINLLFSYLNAEDEQRIESYLQTHCPDVFISRSSMVLPEYKEYERGITTWLNAWVGPLVQGYISRLQTNIGDAKLTVMQSSGGTMAAEHAAQNAVKMLLSGPAGGLAGANYIAQKSSKTAKNQHLLTFDMGGTSTDVALIEDELQLTNEGHIGEYPVAISMVDMHTIGAGGGSIAQVDEGGILQVGPESAGASPGPACYGLGGKHATVTDANLVLGRLSANDFLGGAMALDVEASQQVIANLADQLSLTVEETAKGIIDIANEHMSSALRVMSIQRGIDPKNLLLMPFGGAGALHVCALADNLQMTQALIPVHAGVLSALGMIVAKPTRDLSHTINIQLDVNCELMVTKQLQVLADRGIEELVSEGVNRAQITERFSVDLRYVGQSYTLNVPWSDVNDVLQHFHQLHRQRYGHQHQQAIELVNLRVQVSALPLQLNLPMIEESHASPIQSEQRQIYGVDQPVNVYKRHSLLKGQTLSGPAIIVERVSTTFIEPGWQCLIDEIGNLLLRKVV